MLDRVLSLIRFYLNSIITTYPSYSKLLFDKYSAFLRLKNVNGLLSWQSFRLIVLSIQLSIKVCSSKKKWILYTYVTTFFKCFFFQIITEWALKITFTKFIFIITEKTICNVFVEMGICRNIFITVKCFTWNVKTKWQTKKWHQNKSICKHLIW